MFSMPFGEDRFPKEAEDDLFCTVETEDFRYNTFGIVGFSQMSLMMMIMMVVVVNETSLSCPSAVCWRLRSFSRVNWQKILSTRAVGRNAY